MKNRLRHIPDTVFSRYMQFAEEHPKIITRHHLLQKLIIFDFVLPLVSEHPHDAILEIGAGQGVHSALLSQFGNVSATELAAPGSFVGADHDVDQDRAAVFGSLARHAVSFTYNDGRQLPYPDNSFDIVFHNSVIEHVPDIAAFNREIHRVLKPGGICICITGTPALCWFRFGKDYLLKLPFRAAMALAREIMPTTWLHRIVESFLKRLGAGDGMIAKVKERLLPIHKRLQAVVGSIPGDFDRNQCLAINIRSLYPRLFHYLYYPAYNRIVVEEIAQEYGISVETLLQCVEVHFRSLFNRILFGLVPGTHGQHYRNFRDEMKKWKLSNWTTLFITAGFSVENIIGYRYHHIVEVTPRYAWDTALYYRAAKYIHAVIARGLVNPARASEVILVAKKTAEPA